MRGLPIGALVLLVSLQPACGSDSDDKKGNGSSNSGGTSSGDGGTAGSDGNDTSDTGGTNNSGGSTSSGGSSGDGGEGDTGDTGGTGGENDPGCGVNCVPRPAGPCPDGTVTWTCLGPGGSQALVGLCDSAPVGGVAFCCSPEFEFVCGD